ncbi:helix-turn-helix domain-containing protein [Aeromicrobium sp. UC242_57]|uniref:helix-turn-helix domain-containing protein n=1 Tax=Aeromicrobium sp. UC242_57 TaxID=3374624 RepID=UPI0037A545F4
MIVKSWVYIDGTEEIAVAAGLLEARTKRLDPLERIRALDEAIEQVGILRVQVGDLRAQAVRDYASEVGPTAAARELGISRNRIYQLIKEADQE